MIFDVNNPDTFLERCVAAKANSIYGTDYSLADARFDTQTFRFYNGSEYIARLIGLDVRFDRRGYSESIPLADIYNDTSEVVEEWEHHNVAKYDTSMDPISPNFDISTWAQTPVTTQSVVLMNITKETTVGDVAIVPEHRCDIEDTQAHLASQFMQAYGIDVLIAHKYNGYVLTFRKVD